MEVFFVVLFAAMFFFAGYAFRGFVGKELKTLSADLKAEFAEVKAAVKAKI